MRKTIWANALSNPNSAPWILEGDIKGCFDNISFEWVFKRYRMLDTLAAEVKESVAQLEAVKQAAMEWADRNNVPVEVFSEPMAILNLGEKADSVKADEETLSSMRGVVEAEGPRRHASRFLLRDDTPPALNTCFFVHGTLPF
ncbi:MAG: hypothetical protein ACQET7_14035 [Thermodesulfobacteriota bacterium]